MTATTFISFSSSSYCVAIAPFGTVVTSATLTHAKLHIHAVVTPPTDTQQTPDRSHYGPGGGDVTGRRLSAKEYQNGPFLHVPPSARSSVPPPQPPPSAGLRETLGTYRFNT